MSDAPRVTATRHVLAVNDLTASTAHFVDVLGFTREFVIEGWAFLSLDGFRLMLGECPDEVPAAATDNHSYFAHVLVADAAVLYTAMHKRGATFARDLTEQPWGHRDFCVVTPDGHRMVFAQEIA